MKLEELLWNFNFNYAAINVELSRCTDVYYFGHLMGELKKLAIAYENKANAEIKELEELGND
ncbi:MAG: hypothetical protein ACXACU_15850 [Candidatus Hodarchaeales archaeon]|jgi:hypothetical protein